MLYDMTPPSLRLTLSKNKNSRGNANGSVFACLKRGQLR
jgi:hypothetical protein